MNVLSFPLWPVNSLSQNRKARRTSSWACKVELNSLSLYCCCRSNMSPGLHAQLLRSFKGPGYLYPQRKMQFIIVQCFWYDETIIGGLGELAILDIVSTVWVAPFDLAWVNDIPRVLKAFLCACFLQELLGNCSANVIPLHSPRNNAHSVRLLRFQDTRILHVVFTDWQNHII